jgi:hypothetical protein
MSVHVRFVSDRVAQGQVFFSAYLGLSVEVSLPSEFHTRLNLHYMLLWEPSTCNAVAASCGTVRSTFLRTRRAVLLFHTLSRFLNYIYTHTHSLARTHTSHTVFANSLYPGKSPGFLNRKMLYTDRERREGGVKVEPSHWEIVAMGQISGGDKSTD